ncbi:hypothetical protein [Actinosynnema sp. NPDC020468]|uniref:hypothetical protein n=1 Tax=Actinosynnema sp. NPDC020468 TaxID=3154488 RepID=UPI003407FBF7
MHQQWKINGVYATWTVSIDVTAPDTTEDPDPTPETLTRTPNFEGLVHHFRSIVDMNEALQELNRA